MNDDLAMELIRAVNRVADELEKTRVMTENCSGTKINDFNWKQIEGAMGSGILRGTFMPGPPPTDKKIIS